MDQAAPKGASDFEELSASLKRCPDTNPARLKPRPFKTEFDPIQVKPDSLVFQGETKLFNDRIRQNFTRDPFHFRLRFIL